MTHSLLPRRDFAITPLMLALLALTSACDTESDTPLEQASPAINDAPTAETPPNSQLPSPKPVISKDDNFEDTGKARPALAMHVLVSGATALLPSEVRELKKLASKLKLSWNGVALEGAARQHAAIALKAEGDTLPSSYAETADLGVLIRIGIPNENSRGKRVSGGVSDLMIHRAGKVALRYQSAEMSEKWWRKNAFGYGAASLSIASLRPIVKDTVASLSKVKS